MTIRRSVVQAIAIILALFFWPAGAATASEQPKPLFQSDTVITLTIDAPLGELIRKRKTSTDPYSATLTVTGADPITEAGTIAARGKSRRTRGVCRFPPLRVRFDKRPKSGLFKGQKSLKLVTHCKDKDSYEDNLLLEYSAYRLFNVLTPYSHNVRLARIDYRDSDNGETIASRFGFFIEDADDVADRFGMVELDIPSIQHNMLDRDTAARVELFNYLLSNLDFSLVKAPANSDCCHNTKLIAKSEDAAEPRFPIPYDFDNTGWVDPEYSLLPANVDVRSVRDRVFRGQCSRLSEIREHKQDFISRRQDLETVINDVPNLPDKRRKKAQAFLTSFYNIIEDPERFERNIVKACR